MPDQIPTAPPVNALQTLSGVFGIQQQKQQLQLQAQELQRSQIQTQQAQGVNQFFSSWTPGDHHGQDGTVDIDSAHQSAQYQSLPGVAKIAVDQQLNQMRGQQLDNKSKLSQLNGDVVNQAGKVFQAAAADPDNAPAILKGFSDQGPDQKRIMDIYSPLIQKVPAEKRQGALTTMAAQAQDVSAQQSQTNPDQLAVSRGGSTDIYNVNKAKGLQPGQTPVSSVTNTIPPGFELTEDPITHNKFLWNRQSGVTRPFGSGAPTGGGGGPATPNAPPSAPPQRSIGEAGAQEAQVNTNFQNHQANVNASRTANQQLDQIRNVASLLDEGVKTGQGAQTLSKAEQGLSNIPGLSGLAGADSQAAKFDLLNKFLERIGADYGSLNGSPAKTDAGAESLRSQIGSTGYNSEALRSVMKYTAAQYQAAKAKDAGEQQFLGQKGNGILNQDQFEKQWRNSYDPRVFQLANEPKEVAKAAIQKMDPADRAGFLKKYAELKTMGAAPQ